MTKGGNKFGSYIGVKALQPMPRASLSRMQRTAVVRNASMGGTQVQEWPAPIRLQVAEEAGEARTSAGVLSTTRVSSRRFAVQTRLFERKRERERLSAVVMMSGSLQSEKARGREQG